MPSPHVLLFLLLAALTPSVRAEEASSSCRRCCQGRDSSCYERSGSERCYCDEGCLTTGDCCRDYHRVCAVQGEKPYLPTSPSVYQPLPVRPVKVCRMGWCATLPWRPRPQPSFSLHYRSQPLLEFPFWRSFPIRVKRKWSHKRQMRRLLGATPPIRRALASLFETPTPQKHSTFEGFRLFFRTKKCKKMAFLLQCCQSNVKLLTIIWSNKIICHAFDASLTSFAIFFALLAHPTRAKESSLSDVGHFFPLEIHFSWVDDAL